MDSVFIFKPEREGNNELNYVPYFDIDKDNDEYEIFDVEKKLEKLGRSKLSNIICQENVTNDFVRIALGFGEKELYEEAEDDSISVHESSKGVDILIIWTDSKSEETNKKKRLQSLRGMAGLYIRQDKHGEKYAEVAIICNAPSSARKTRKANIKKRGKDVLKLIEEIAKGENVKYIALKALDNVVTYYHKFGYKLRRKDIDNKKNIKIFICGGSQGASSLNRKMMALIKKIPRNFIITITINN